MDHRRRQNRDRLSSSVQPLAGVPGDVLPLPSEFIRRDGVDGVDMLVKKLVLVMHHTVEG
jgi:hypothetical protein